MSQYGHLSSLCALLNLRVSLNRDGWCRRGLFFFWAPAGVWTHSPVARGLAEPMFCGRYSGSLSLSLGDSWVDEKAVSEEINDLRCETEQDPQRLCACVCVCALVSVLEKLCGWGWSGGGKVSINNWWNILAYWCRWTVGVVSVQCALMGGRVFLHIFYVDLVISLIYKLYVHVSWNHFMDQNHIFSWSAASVDKYSYFFFSFFFFF